MRDLVKAVQEHSQETPARVHLGYLDGVRGLAALYVLVFHLYNFQFAIVEGVVGYAVNWLNYGHIAVDVFIVLSGFCLALPAAGTGQLKEGAWKFFGRRARRILPTYYAALLLALALDFAVKHFGHVHAAGDESPFALHTILSNVFLLEEFWDKTNTINSPFWSVALEWKIYFLFPAMIWMWKRSGLPLVMFAAVLAGCGLTFLTSTLKPGNSLILVSPWYVILFASGVCACLWYTGNAALLRKEKIKPLRLAAATSLGLAAVLIYRFPICGVPVQKPEAEAAFGWGLPLIDVSLGVFVAAVLCLVLDASQSSKVYRVLNCRPLVFIGSFSYSLYLIHVPVLEFIRGAISHVLEHGHSALELWIWTVIVGLPSTVAFSYLFHLAFERPFMSKFVPKTAHQAEAAAILSPAP